MMTLDQLNAIHVGSLVEMSGLFHGVDKEKSLALKCTHAKKNIEYVFETSYMGIALGNVVMHIRGTEIEVEDL